MTSMEAVKNFKYNTDWSSEENYKVVDLHIHTYMIEKERIPHTYLFFHCSSNIVASLAHL